MVDYNIVKTCMVCKKRYTVNKSQARRYYCDDCQKKIDKQPKEPMEG